MYMPQGLSLDMKGIRLPNAGAHEDGLVTVTEQIVHSDGSSDMDIWPHLDAL